MSKMWNLWHGCHKYSEGCLNCYVHRGDMKYDRDISKVFKTKQFNVPIEKNKNGEYKVKSGEFVFTCFSSDFLLADADIWRQDAWDMIKERSDCNFLFITKRIERFMQCVPDDWGNGYPNVIVCTTCENQKQLDFRMPIFLDLPIKHKCLVIEPMLEEMDIAKYLKDNQIEQVIAGGESGEKARHCHYDWILKLRSACVENNVTFNFKQTGTHFIKDSKHYKIPRKMQHIQARKANINFVGKGANYLAKR